MGTRKLKKIDRNKLAERFDNLHAVGAKRHGMRWFAGNRAAVAAIWNAGKDTSNLEIKTMASDIVLRVLNAVCAPIESEESSNG